MGKMSKFLNLIGLEETDGSVGNAPSYYEDEFQEGMENNMNYNNDDAYFAQEENRRYQSKRNDNIRPFVGNDDVRGGYSGSSDSYYGSEPDTSRVRVLIYKPTSYDDTQSIVDNLRDQRPIIVNLDELETDVAQRILDFVSGAVYALSGSIRKAAKNIFVVAPYNIDVTTNAADSVHRQHQDEFNFRYFENDGLV